MDKITQLQCQLHNLAFYMTEPLYAIKFHSPPVAVFKGSEVIQDEEVLHRINEFRHRTLNVLAKNIVDTSNNVKILIDALPEETSNEELDSQLQTLELEYEKSVEVLSKEVITAERMLKRVKEISNSLTSTAIEKSFMSNNN